MKTFLTTTALGLVLMAANVSAENMKATDAYQPQATDIRASEFIGSRIYATEDDVSGDMAMSADAEKNWDDIGEVNDVILNKDGDVQAVIVGVGGFVGLGEKDVAIPMSGLKFVSDGEQPDEYFLVVNATKDILTEASAYTSENGQQANTMDEGTSDMMKNQDTASNSTMENGSTDMTNNQQTGEALGQTAPENEQMAASESQSGTTATGTMKNEEQMAAGETQSMDSGMTDNTQMADRNTLERPENLAVDGFQASENMDMTAKNLEGAPVYGADGENIGEVSQIVLSADGQTVDKLVLDIGGFLGLGEHRIAIGVDEANIMKNEDGSEFRIYIDSNQETLEAQPEYNG